MTETQIKIIDGEGRMQATIDKKCRKMIVKVKSPVEIQSDGAYLSYVIGV